MKRARELERVREVEFERESNAFEMNPKRWKPSARPGACSEKNSCAAPASTLSSDWAASEEWPEKSESNYESFASVAEISRNFRKITKFFKSINEFRHF